MLKGSVPPRCLSAFLEACVGVYAVHLVLFMLFPLLQQAVELAVGLSPSLSLMLKGSVPPRSLPASLEACVSQPAARPLLCRLFRRSGELETRSSLSLSLMLLSPAGVSVPPRSLSASLEACVGKPAARPLLWRLFQQAGKLPTGSSPSLLLMLISSSVSPLGLCAGARQLDRGESSSLAGQRAETGERGAGCSSSHASSCWI